MKKYLKHIAIIISGITASTFLFFNTNYNYNYNAQTPVPHQKPKDEILNKAVNSKNYPEAKKVEKRDGKIILKQ